MRREPSEHSPTRPGTQFTCFTSKLLTINDSNCKLLTINDSNLYFCTKLLTIISCLQSCICTFVL